MEWVCPVLGQDVVGDGAFVTGVPQLSWVLALAGLVCPPPSMTALLMSFSVVSWLIEETLFWVIKTIWASQSKKPEVCWGCRCVLFRCLSNCGFVKRILCKKTHTVGFFPFILWYIQGISFLFVPLVSSILCEIICTTYDAPVICACPYWCFFCLKCWILSLQDSAQLLWTLGEVNRRKICFTRVEMTLWVGKGVH